MYERKNVSIFEAIYGPGMISLGGIEAVRQVLAGTDLNGKIVLDVGSGIGGLSHWVAENYLATAIGLDIHPWMAEYAKTQIREGIRGKTQFLTYDGRTIPLEDSSVDIFVSKGVLTNIEDKRPLFEEFSRLAKPGAKIIFIDWLSPEFIGPVSEELPLGDKSRKETISTYRQIFLESGLGVPSFEDVSDEYLQYVQDLSKKLRSAEHKSKFVKVINEQLRLDLLKANDHLEEQIKSGKQLSIRIVSKNF